MSRLKEILTEAAEWRLLGLLFEYPSARCREQIQALVPEITHGDLVAAAAGARQEASEGLHIALFGPGGPVSLREVTYLGGVQLGYLMSELAAFYGAFDYRPGSEEALDHLAVEAGFLSYLRLKQAYAEQCGEAGHAAIAADAFASFVNAHLTLMAEPIARALDNLAPQYLVHAGRFLAERIGKRPQTPYPLGGELTNGMEDDEMTCGAGESLIQLQP